jgi:predicted RNase H-like HicB family nuclease
MRHELKFTILVETGEEGWRAGKLAELPAVMRQGKTKEGLRENLLDAQELYLEVQREERTREPLATNFGQEHLILTGS